MSAGWATAAVLRAEFGAVAHAPALMLVDVAALALLVGMGWRASPSWALCAATLQSVAVAAHVAHWTDPGVAPELALGVSHGAALAAALVLGAAAPVARLMAGTGLVVDGYGTAGVPMTDTPAPGPTEQPDDETEGDTLPPGGLPSEPQGDEVDPGTGRIVNNVGEDVGDIGEPQAA